MSRIDENCPTRSSGVGWIQRRRAVNLTLGPALELKLPLILLIITLTFVAFQIGHSYCAIGEIFGSVFREVGRPQFPADLIRDQTWG